MAYNNIFKYRSSFLLENLVLSVLDQDERVLIFEFTCLQKDILYQYERYVEIPDEMMKIVESQQNLKVQVNYLADRIHDYKIDENNLVFSEIENSPFDTILIEDLFLVIYNKKIVCYRVDDYSDPIKEINYEEMLKNRRTSFFLKIDIFLNSKFCSAQKILDQGILLQKKVNE